MWIVSNVGLAAASAFNPLASSSMGPFSATSLLCCYKWDCPLQRYGVLIPLLCFNVHNIGYLFENCNSREDDSRHEQVIYIEVFFRAPIALALITLFPLPR